MKRPRQLVLVSAIVLGLASPVLGASSASAQVARRRAPGPPFLSAHRAHHRWHLSTMHRQEQHLARIHGALRRWAPFMAKGMEPMMAGNQRLHGWMESTDNTALAAHEGWGW